MTRRRSHTTVAATPSTGRTPRPRRGPGRPITDPATGSGVPDDSDVLACGLRTFAELGFEATSVRELARRLGVSHNFINDRYGSKDLFWRAVIDRTLGDSLAHGLTAVLGAHYDTELERLTAVIRFSVQQANPLLHQMMSHEAQRPSERIAYINERYIQPMIIGLTPVVAALTRDGIVRPLPWSVLLFLMSAPSQLQAQAPLAHLLGDIDLPRAREREDGDGDDPDGKNVDHTEFFTSLILNAMRPDPATQKPSAATTSPSQNDSSPA